MASKPMPAAVTDAIATAVGQRHRQDPVSPRTGGPAGNAQLTAWLGLLLLMLFVAELLTLLDVRGLISWHIAMGVVLIPFSLAKTVTTGWRLVRYYTNNHTYVVAGPPPLLLRMLGPLVVLGTLAVLSTGVLVTLLGPTRAFRPLLRLPAVGVSPLTLHQASVIVWAAATGVHVLARLVPALQTTRVTAAPVPGLLPRLTVVALATVMAATLVLLGLRVGHPWTQDRQPDPRSDPRQGAAAQAK